MASNFTESDQQSMLEDMADINDFDAIVSLFLPTPLQEIFVPSPTKEEKSKQRALLKGKDILLKRIALGRTPRETGPRKRARERRPIKSDTHFFKMKQPDEENDELENPREKLKKPRLTIDNDEKVISISFPYEKDFFKNGENKSICEAITNFCREELLKDTQEQDSKIIPHPPPTLIL